MKEREGILFQLQGRKAKDRREINFTYVLSLKDSITSAALAGLGFQFPTVNLQSSFDAPLFSSRAD